MPADDFFHRPDADHDRAGRMRECREVSGLAAQSIGVGFFEVSARKSDFAFASALAQVALDEDGLLRQYLCSASVASAIRALRLDVSPLLGTRLDAASVTEAVMRSRATWMRRAICMPVRPIAVASPSRLPGAPLNKQEPKPAPRPLKGAA
jgi:hypothetical protein